MCFNCELYETGAEGNSKTGSFFEELRCDVVFQKY